MVGARKNLEGQTFNGMSILEFVKVVGTTSFYKVLCHCGKTKIMNGSTIKTGRSKSCGCKAGFKRESVYNKLPKGEATFNYYFTRYKSNAKSRNYEFKLTKVEFKELTSKNCIFCGNKPRMIYKKSSGLNGGCLLNGIDRIDNKKGYTLQNSVTCCTSCNRIKSDYTLEEFKNKIKSISKHLGL